ncbi:hypothetical protein AAF712_008774 [Marasmius tenuissimus]|uniref:Heme haloperoxidase family profile domain-containing protein n=1 Tax=Marasmius tenuissimus TaxID=585030 RepID=A0ABR2ZSE2_9AGAR
MAQSDMDFSSYPYMAPGPSDLRSPCPGLNAMANHGFLPRDGRNISIPMILNAADKAFNFERDILVVAGKLGLLTSPDSEDTMSLEDLKLHGVIEQDASFSREDVAIGDSLHFNETIFSTLANSNPGSDVYNTTSAGQVARIRLDDSLARNPNVTNTVLQAQGRAGTSALYLVTMGGVTGVAPKEFVQILFREERLPIEEGWKKSAVPISGATIGELTAAVFKASDWEPTGDQCATIVVPGLNG